MYTQVQLCIGIYNTQLVAQWLTWTLSPNSAEHSSTAVLDWAGSVDLHPQAESW
jgi:hypothetical protein